MITIGIPRQLRYQSVILVEIMSIVGQNDVWLKLTLQLLEALFQFPTEIRKEAVAKIMNGNTTAGTLKEMPRRL